ncbi:DUF1178 family protein [Fodinicurvata halophila]|uniref:DUF1178 family protein n=1 Tax=Fodinicurvata halophila TaxID=1419723 RepID=A0ABV8UIR7_9PROT
MILYSLRCEQAHQFDVWFRDSSAYDRQVAEGVVVCPQCGSQKVEKAIMAPRLSKGAAGGEETEAASQGKEVVPAAGHGEQASANAAPEANAAPSSNASTEAGEGQTAPTEAEVRQALRQLRQYVEANSDYVGSGFAEEARRIHNEEAPQRNIYGETTAEEAEELEDEGVPFARVPWINREDA